MATKKKPKNDRGWEVLRMRAAGTVSLGIVYAADVATAIEKAAEQHSVPEALRSRLVARPWLG
jgi:hypothetical protein